MRASFFIFGLLLLLAGCSSDDGKKEEIQKATAYLNNDPTASSTDGMTFGDPGYWHNECKDNTQLWQAAVHACQSDNLHPPVCQLIVNSKNACPGV